MNKKTIITVMFALVAMTGQSQENNYTIHGDFSEIIEIVSKNGLVFDSITIVNPETLEKVARQDIVNGEFTVHGIVEKPYYAQLNIWGTGEVNGEKRRTNHKIPIIIEPGNIEFNANARMPNASGTPLNNVVSEATTMDKTPDFIKVVKELVLLHKDDVAAVPLLLLLNDNMAEPDSTLLSLISQCGEDIQRHRYIVGIKENAELLLSRLNVGDMFKDFVVEYDGQQQRLSDYVGRGQYVFVDFWASWCKPCLREIPVVVEAYNKYKDKGLQVVGVACNDTPEQSVKFIREQAVPYPQIFNVGFSEMEVYGIITIPETILFAPDGTIVARGLRGEDIERKLAEIFDKK